MAVATYTKAGTKATAAATLDKKVFGLKVTNHQLLKEAYLAYLGNGRTAGAKTLKRGQVSGGGNKPWRQKGTGNARFGSSRNPIWRGGGIAFGPTGEQNYTVKLSTQAKRQALRQALSLASTSDKIKVIETFACPDGKVKPTVALLKKIDAKGPVLIVVSKKDDLVERATKNVPGVKAVQANYLNVYDVLNATTIVISKKSLEMVNEWLGADKMNPLGRKKKDAPTKKVAKKVDKTVVAEKKQKKFNPAGKSMTLKPRVSEKTYALSESGNTYVFEVPKNISKQFIGDAVAAQYEVGVVSVRISATPGKTQRTYKRGGRLTYKGQRSNIRKAFVTLQEGDKLPIFASVEDSDNPNKETK